MSKKKRKLASVIGRRKREAISLASCGVFLRKKEESFKEDWAVEEKGGLEEESISKVVGL